MAIRGLLRIDCEPTRWRYSAKIFGVKIGRITLRESPNESLSIWSLHIRPLARHQGVAQTLVQICIDEAQKQKKRMWLIVEEDNRAAIALYKKNGFVQTHRRKEKKNEKARITMVLSRYEQKN